MNLFRLHTPRKIYIVHKLTLYVYLIAIVGPATKLHITVLIIEGEPRDVYLACALENARRHVQATAVVSDHHVGLVRPVKTLVSTKKVHILSVDIDNQINVQ